jgi:hypothetical protein
MEDEDDAWDAFVNAAKAWAQYLDQWDKIKFQTEHGMVYVTISRADPYPDSFHKLEVE